MREDYTSSAKLNHAIDGFFWDTKLGRLITILSILAIFGPILYFMGKDNIHRKKNIKMFNEQFHSRCVLEGVTLNECKALSKAHEYICFNGATGEDEAVKKYTTCLMQRHDPAWKPTK